ncbi:MAG: Bifunctional protein HldE [Nitrospira sp.]|nr:Bifunctional protein HldE [Nitrospira sp.]
MTRILVIGESCRDIFVYCDALRLAPDLPVPVLNVIDQSENPGMAMNVKLNIEGLGGEGDIVTNDAWEQVTKTRYVHKPSNHLFMRVDTDHHIPRIDLSSLSLGYDLIAISDYHKGFLTEDDIASICSRHPSVFIDTKKPLGAWAEGGRYIKINDYEYKRSRATLTPALEEKIICTKGGAGAVFRGKAYPVAEVIEVKDATGAGDTFFAGLLVRYAQTGDIEAAIEFANTCASEVVQQRGVNVAGKIV